MKYGTLFLLLISFLSMRLQAITEEPYFYYFKVLAKKTNEEIPFANLTLKMNDTVIGTGITAINGIAVIKASKKLKNASLITTSTGFESTMINNLNMKLKDTLVLRINEKAQQLDVIEVISYQMPLIDPDKPQKKKWFQKKAPLPPPELIIEYTREELTTKQELLDGIHFADSLVAKNAATHTSYFPLTYKMLDYPEKARTAGIQEKLYFLLSFSSKGNLSEIRLLKGNDPALVYAAYKALRTLINLKIPRGNGVAFTLPIHFKLR